MAAIEKEHIMTQNSSPFVKRSKPCQRVTDNKKSKRKVKLKSHNYSFQISATDVTEYMYFQILLNVYHNL